VIRDRVIRVGVRARLLFWRQRSAVLGGLRLGRMPLSGLLVTGVHIVGLAFGGMYSCIEVPPTSRRVPGASSVESSSIGTSVALSQSSWYVVTPGATGSATSTSSSTPCTISRMRLNSSWSGVEAARYCRVRFSGEFQSSSSIRAPVASNQSMWLAFFVVWPKTAYSLGRKAGLVRRSSRRRLVVV
jgi:hypothetical protein